MWKYALSFALLLAFGALLFPRNEGAPRIANLSPAEEIKVKQATLSQDMKLTDDLCRSQCSLELGMFSRHVPGLDTISIGTELHDLHSPKETVRYASVAKVWPLVREVVGRLG